VGRKQSTQIQDNEQKEMWHCLYDHSCANSSRQGHPTFTPYMQMTFTAPSTQEWFLDRRDIIHLILSPYKSYHLLTNIGVFRYTGNNALQDIPYLLDEPRVSSTNYYNRCTYRNSKPQTQTHSYFLTLWCQILERTTICCINVFHMTCLVLRYQRSKRNT
jgi:hypothetical protein